MPVTEIDATQVRKLLPVKDCIQSVREAMIAFSKDNVHVPLRSTAYQVTVLDQGRIGNGSSYGDYFLET